MDVPRRRNVGGAFGVLIISTHFPFYLIMEFLTHIIAIKMSHSATHYTRFLSIVDIKISNRGRTFY